MFKISLGEYGNQCLEEVETDINDNGEEKDNHEEEDNTTNIEN